MRGDELCVRIKEQEAFKDVPVIVMTAHTDLETRRITFAVGAVDFVQKPFDRVELQARTGVHIRQYRQAQERQALVEQLREEAEAKAQQLVHADRLSTLGTLSASIAHEINNPNMYVRGNANIMDRLWPTIEEGLRECQSQGIGDAKRINMALEEMPKMIAAILDGTDRISAIVESVKHYSKVQSQSGGPCDLNEVLQQAMDLCQNTLKKDIEIDLQLASNLPAVRGDAQQLVQVLINLMVNAVHAMEGQSRTRKMVIASRPSSPDTVELTIRDTGKGIPADKLNSIWDAFYTTKPNEVGTGLGLSVVRSIMRRHAATIDVESTQGVGTTFTLHFSSKQADTANTVHDSSGSCPGERSESHTPAIRAA